MCAFSSGAEPDQATELPDEFPPPFVGDLCGAVLVDAEAFRPFPLTGAECAEALPLYLLHQKKSRDVEKLEFGDLPSEDVVNEACAFKAVGFFAGAVFNG